MIQAVMMLVVYRSDGRIRFRCEVAKAVAAARGTHSFHIKLQPGVRSPVISPLTLASTVSMPRRKRLFTLLDLSIDICALRTARSLISAEYAMSAANQEVAHTSSGAGLGCRASLPRRVLYQMSTLNSGRAVE